MLTVHLLRPPFSTCPVLADSCYLVLICTTSNPWKSARHCGVRRYIFWIRSKINWLMMWVHNSEYQRTIHNIESSQGSKKKRIPSLLSLPIQIHVGTYVNVPYILFVLLCHDDNVRRRKSWMLMLLLLLLLSLKMCQVWILIDIITLIPKNDLFFG